MNFDIFVECWRTARNLAWAIWWKNCLVLNFSVVSVPWKLLNWLFVNTSLCLRSMPGSSNIFCNFVFGFSSLKLRDFLYYVFRLQGKMGKTKWKINKLLRNILVTSSPKTTKNDVTKMGWNAQYLKLPDQDHRLLLHSNFQSVLDRVGHISKIHLSQG